MDSGGPQKPSHPGIQHLYYESISQFRLHRKGLYIFESLHCVVNGVRNRSDDMWLLYSQRRHRNQQEEVFGGDGIVDSWYQRHRPRNEEQHAGSGSTG